VPRRVMAVVGILIVAVSILALIGRNRRAAKVDPCFQDGLRPIRVLYLARRQSPKRKANGGGCASCEAQNTDQWNALYRVFGGREGIEFIVILPKGAAFPGGRALRCDVSIIGSDHGEEDKVVICERGVKRLEHAGVMDMAFIRKAYAILAEIQENPSKTSHF